MAPCRGKSPQLLTDKSFKRLNLALLPTLALAMHGLMSKFTLTVARFEFSRTGLAGGKGG